MRRKGALALLTSLGALSALLFALTPVSQADDVTDRAVCIFNGATDAFTPIVQAVDDPRPLADAEHTESDGDLDSPDDEFNASGVLGPGDGVPTGTGNNLLDLEGGSYTFSTSPSPLDPALPDEAESLGTSCLHEDSDGFIDTTANNTGLYASEITAAGTYENLVCGTGSTEGSATLTTVDKLIDSDGDHQPNLPADGGADPEAATLGADYFIMFVAGQGALLFTGEVTPGARDFVGTGVVDIRPTPSITAAPNDDEGCVTTDVTNFDVTGIIAGSLDGGNVRPTLDGILP